MKVYLIAFFLSLGFIGCGSPPETNTNSEIMHTSTQQIQTFSFSVSAELPIGYGYRYEAQRFNESGQALGDPFYFTMLISEEEDWSKFRLNQLMTGTFEKDEEDFPYETAPLTGFVDAEHTSWKLISLE